MLSLTISPENRDNYSPTFKKSPKNLANSPQNLYKSQENSQFSEKKPSPKARYSVFIKNVQDFPRTALLNPLKSRTKHRRSSEIVAFQSNFSQIRSEKRNFKGKSLEKYKEIIEMSDCGEKSEGFAKECRNLLRNVSFFSGF